MKKSKRYIKKLTKTPLINKRVMNYIINNSNICKHAIRELKLADTVMVKAVQMIGCINK